MLAVVGGGKSNVWGTGQAETDPGGAGGAGEDWRRSGHEIGDGRSGDGGGAEAVGRWGSVEVAVGCCTLRGS